MRLLWSVTEALDARLTTGSTEQRADRSGWTMFAVMVQRQISPRVHIAAGLSTTVDIARTWLYCASTVVCSNQISIQWIRDGGKLPINDAISC